MDNQKRFTSAQIRYIICIYHLAQHDDGVKNLDIATALGFSKPSVHNMLKSLCDIGIVRQESFGLAHFTDLGRQLSQKYEMCFLFLEKKMTELCGTDSMSETAICGLLAEIPPEKIDEIYVKQKNRI